MGGEEAGRGSHKQARDEKRQGIREGEGRGAQKIARRGRAGEGCGLWVGWTQRRTSLGQRGEDRGGEGEEGRRGGWEGKGTR